MILILKSGKAIKNVKCLDRTKSPIGLWVWSTNQVRDQLLSFDKITVRASEIAAIVEEPDEKFEHIQDIEITDDDLPF